MQTFNDLLEEHTRLLDELGGVVKLTPQIRERIKVFMQNIGKVFGENNETIARNPSHVRVPKLRKENKEISRLLTLWERKIK